MTKHDDEQFALLRERAWANPLARREDLPQNTNFIQLDGGRIRIALTLNR